MFGKFKLAAYALYLFFCIISAAAYLFDGFLNAFSYIAAAVYVISAAAFYPAISKFIERKHGKKASHIAFAVRVIMVLGLFLFLGAGISEYQFAKQRHAEILKKEKTLQELEKYNKMTPDERVAYVAEKSRREEAERLAGIKEGQADLEEEQARNAQDSLEWANDRAEEEYDDYAAPKILFKCTDTGRLWVVKGDFRGYNPLLEKAYVYCGGKSNFEIIESEKN